MRKTDVVFFLSGAAALGYETVWARLLARVLGSDASASAIVLAVFMGGMGLGAYAFAERARKTAQPVRLFALLELLVGAWAALSPWILERLDPVDGFVARALVCAAILLPPTFVLGATFPLMGRIAIRTRGEASSETSAFYGANTLGAAFGALLAPFVLMPRFGLSGALVASAFLDVIAALLAWVLLRPEPEFVEEIVPRESTHRTRDATPSAWREPLLWIAFTFGFASLALEVLGLRILITVAGASVYAFAIVVCVFLLGIAIGSRQLTERRARTGVKDSELVARTAKSRAALFYCALAAPLLTLAGLFALRFQLGESDLFAGLTNRAPQGASVVALWSTQALLAGLCLLPPAIAFGMALPSAAAALVGARTDWTREKTLGLVYAWNTAGALSGSLLAAFVLIPHLGFRIAFALVFVLLFAAAYVVAPARKALVGLALAAGAAIGWNVLSPSDPRDSARTVLVNTQDAHTTALVLETRTHAGGVVRSIVVNGKSEASTALVDVRLQYLLGHIPGLLHGNVRRALVIGLGTGMTSGSLLDLPTLEQLTLVEISPAVSRAARSFAAWNGGVLDDPRTHLVFADGRHVLATSDQRFDLITSDPVHPWTRGSSDLYTLEHFRTMSARLAPGGVASQWLPLYELSTDDVKTIVATWCAAYEHVSAWLTAYDLVLVGSREPLPHASDLATLTLPPKIRAHDEGLGIVSGTDVAVLQVAGDLELRALANGVPPMRDDRPVIEFQAPLSSLSGYSTEILRWAIRPEYVSVLPAEVRARAAAFRGHIDEFLTRLPNGFTSASDRLGEDLRALPARAGTDK